MQIRALLVGINVYDSAPTLRGCVNDVEAMARLVVDRFGLTPEQEQESMLILLDRLATKEAICSGLEWLADTSEVGVEVPRLLYYSGHGSFLADENGDEIDGCDECLVPSDHDTNGLLRDDVLRDWRGSLDEAQHALVIVDTCHAGTMLVSGDLPPAARNALDRRWLVPAFAPPAGVTPTALTGLQDRAAPGKGPAEPEPEPAPASAPAIRAPRGPAVRATPQRTIPVAPQRTIPVALQRPIPAAPHRAIDSRAPGSLREIVRALVAEEAPALAARVVARAHAAVPAADPLRFRQELVASLRATLFDSLDDGVLVEAVPPPGQAVTARFISPPAGMKAELRACREASAARVVSRVETRLAQEGDRHFAPVSESTEVVSDELQAQDTRGTYGLGLLGGNVVLIAACDAGQLASEAAFDDGDHGALTHHLLKVLKDDPTPTYATLLQRITEAMEETFRQTPQLECSEANRDRPFLGAFPSA